MNVFVSTKDEIAAHARASAWEKDYTNSWFILRKDFGGRVVLEINTSRETVCRKVVTGTRVVPAQPAQEAHIVEEFEWVCEESLLAATAAERS